MKLFRLKRYLGFVITTAFMGIGFPISTYAATQTIPYTVSQGDTLFKIAHQFNTSVDILLKSNHLANDKLQIGQQLQVPGTVAQVNKQPVTQVAQSPAKQTVTNAAVATSDSQVPTPPDVSAKGALLEPFHVDAEVRVNVPVLNVRATPSTDSTILTKLTLGTNLRVLGSDPEWTKVNVSGQDAYVATAFLSSIIPHDVIESVDSNKFTGLIESLLKTPYVTGGTTTNGFDCSGFTLYVFQQLGVTLPRTSDEQFTVGQEVPADQLQQGDLLFYDSLKKGKVSHVAIYMGNGMIVHANGDDVRYEKVEYMNKLYPYYGAKRVVHL